jgi:hypothetical protein
MKPAAARELAALGGHDVWLDLNTGEYYCYEQGSREVPPWLVLVERWGCSDGQTVTTQQSLYCEDSL